jgi:hypothetical protein
MLSITSASILLKLAGAFLGAWCMVLPFCWEAAGLMRAATGAVVFDEDGLLV